MWGLIAGALTSAQIAPTLSFRYQLKRVIPREIHQMPTGGVAWVWWRSVLPELESVANGGHVENGAFRDVQFTHGPTVPLDHDEVTYNATTGELSAYVKLTGFLANQDYVLTLHYGSTTIEEDLFDPVSCWAGFDLVNDLSTGFDRTGNSRDLELEGVGSSTILNSPAGELV